MTLTMWARFAIWSALAWAAGYLATHLPPDIPGWAMPLVSAGLALVTAAIERYSPVPAAAPAPIPLAANDPRHPQFGQLSQSLMQQQQLQAGLIPQTMVPKKETKP